MTHLPRLACMLAAAALATACAANHSIQGQVLDRNGEPVPSAVVYLKPGDVSLMTDTEGRFQFDYLRDETGARVKLERKTEYQLEVFKLGYHDYTDAITYTRGPWEVPPVTMVEASIDVNDMPENLDPALYSRPTQSSGATYEGQ